MDSLNSLMYFVRTAELGSFVNAGRVLGLSASAVGKGVTRLEEQLGVRLFQRTTRSIQLTSEGRAFLERCRRALNELDDAKAMLSHSHEKPSGRLRISMPAASQPFFEAAILAFMTQYPEVELDLDFSDAIVNLIDEGVDIAIRTGKLPDSRLIKRALPPFQLILCAAPAYLEKHGTPLTPRDIDGHSGIRFRYVNSGKLQGWPLKPMPDEPELRTQTVFISNNMEMVRNVIVAGFGIGAVPEFLISHHLKDGTLVPLLSDYLKEPGLSQMVWPSSKQLSQKIRVFVDFVSDYLDKSLVEK